MKLPVSALSPSQTKRHMYAKWGSFVTHVGFSPQGESGQTRTTHKSLLALASQASSFSYACMASMASGWSST